MIHPIRPAEPAPEPVSAATDHAREIAHLSVINETGRALLRVRTSEEVYSIVHEAACRLVAHDVFSIALYDLANDRLRLDYYVEGETRYPPLEHSPLPALQRRISSSYEPLLLASRQEIAQATGGQTWHSGDLDRVAETVLYVPLLGEGRIGVLSVQSYRPNAFSGQDVEKIQLLANQAAGALENARLWRSLHESLGAHRTLIKTARALHAALDEGEIAAVVARELRRIVACSRSLLIMLLDESRAWLTPAYHDGKLATIDRERNRMHREEGLCGEVLRARRPIRLGPGETLPCARRVEGAPDEPNSLLAVPLIGHRDAVGVMILTRGPDEKPFDDRASDTAMLFADQAATAIENARLYQLARSQADRDPLTGLLNHRAFQQALERQMKLALRHRRPLSVLMLDLDRFKGINDTHGHIVGDQALRHVAATLKTTCRETDIVGRYGGEEFVIIFPDTDEAGAHVTAERIRLALLHQGFERAGHGRIPLSISAGVASYPMDGSEASSLVSVADSRLYVSKRRGGNVITTGTSSAGAMPRPAGAISALDTLIAAVDAKDRYTRRHTERVTGFARLLAQTLGLAEETQRTIQIAGLLLDIGKIAVPDSILRKEGRLTEEEMAVVHQHPTLGTLIVNEIANLEHVLGAIRSHHERWDGTGYPDGLAGEQIPFLARLFAIADSYAAMTLDRPYRSALSPEAAKGELRSGAGSRYDPQLVEAFLIALEAQERADDALRLRMAN